MILGTGEDFNKMVAQGKRGLQLAFKDKILISIIENTILSVTYSHKQINATFWP